MRTEPEPDWRDKVACGDTALDWFFPEGRNSTVRVALAICHECPVRLDCLEDALKWPAPEQHGVVGGLDAHERRAILRRRGKVA